MYQFKDNNSAVYYHEQKFTLQWDFPEASRVVVRYFNGNKRVVLPIVTDSSKQVVDGSKFKVINFLLWLSRKKKRSYRYKRFFFRKPVDEFSNIANFRSQSIKLTVLSSQYPWLKTYTVPMTVKILRLKENKINVFNKSIYLRDLDLGIKSQNVSVKSEIPSVMGLAIDLKNVDMRLNKSQNSLNLMGTNLESSIEMLIQTNKIDNKTDLNNILSKIK
jgi:hypothetical protein